MQFGNFGIYAATMTMLG